MSTRVARRGTTGPGRSRRLVGMAAVGLSLVIAAGFVFALNSGNEPTAVPAHPSVAARNVWEDRHDFMAGQVADVAASPTLNIEKYKLEMAGVIGATKPFSIIGGEANQVPAAARFSSVDPTLNIEKYKLEMAGVIGATKPFSIIGGEANQVPAAARVSLVDPTLNIEKYKLDVQNATRALDVASQRYEEYAKLLAEQAIAQAVKSQAVWDQRFDDLVERFQNQLNGGNGLTPLQGRF